MSIFSWPFGLLVGGIAMLAVPRRTLALERRILRFLRLRFIKSLDQPISPGEIRLERALGLGCIAMAAVAMAGIRFGLIDTAKAAEPLAVQPPPAVSGRVQTAVAETAQAFLVERRPVGFAVGVIDGGTSFVLGFGETKLGTGEAPTSRTLFEIGSITKTFTSAVLADLVCRGKLKLDQPVEELFPGKVVIPASGDRKITLVDLATHSSGLPRLPSDMFLTFRVVLPSFWDDPYRKYTPERLMSFLESHKLERAPGTKSEYSNLGAGVLGYALSRFTESTYEAMVRRHVCDPLGMDDTVISLSAEREKRLAQGYSGSEQVGPTQAAEETGNWTFQDSLAGGGALRSTAADMLRYMDANLTPTTGPLGRAFELAQTPRFAGDDDTTAGLGWFTIPDKEIPGGLIFHNGGTGGYSCVIVFSRNERCGVVVLCNTKEDKITRLGLELLRTVVRERKK